jgi:hypothetical protein
LEFQTPFFTEQQSIPRRANSQTRELSRELSWALCFSENLVARNVPQQLISDPSTPLHERRTSSAVSSLVELVSAQASSHLKQVQPLHELHRRHHDVDGAVAGYACPSAAGAANHEIATATVAQNITIIVSRGIM